MAKLLRMMVSDGSFRWRLIGVGVLLAVLLGEFGVLKAQGEKISRLEEDVQKRAQQKITMSATGEGTRARKVMPPKSVPDVVYSLEGTTESQGQLYAVINGHIYKTGDELNSFVVDNITMTSATLRHPATHEIRILQFSLQNF